jgi:hypothetical protein
VALDPSMSNLKWEPQHVRHNELGVHSEGRGARAVPETRAGFKESISLLTIKHDERLARCVKTMEGTVLSVVP